MILVVGATGMVGEQVCRRLREQHEQVRALVRTTSQPEKLDRLRSYGAELVFGDLKDAPSLAAACRDVEAVISTASSTLSRAEGDSIETVDRLGQLSLVQAARTAGVGRFIFISFRQPQGVSVPLAEAKLQVEQSLSDFTFTIIQASFFMEVWLSPAMGFNYPEAKARIYGPGESPISWVSLVDVAHFAVLALRHPAAAKRVIEFGGPEPLSPLDVVARFEAHSGHPFTREHIPAEILMAQFEAAQDPMQKSFAALTLGFVHGDRIPMQATAAEFGLDLLTVDQYARRVLGTPSPGL